MEAWAWWLIWGGLALASLIYFGYLGLELFNKSARAMKELEVSAKLLEPLMAELENPAQLPVFEGNLLDDPSPLIAEHTRNLKKREAKRQGRQRRLINKLIDYDESEFKP